MKSCRKILAVFSAVTIFYGGANVYAAEVDMPTAKEDTKSTAPIELPYSYESTAYGYRIMCPQRPVGVIPANALFENREGEILIFENEEYHIKYAWVILVNAFSDDSVPNLNTITRSRQLTFWDELWAATAMKASCWSTYRKATRRFLPQRQKKSRLMKMVTALWMLRQKQTVRWPFCSFAEKMDNVMVLNSLIIQSFAPLLSLHF